MKIKGKRLERPNREVIPLPRGDGEDIIFIAQAILSYEEFDQLVPEPKPGIKLKRGGERVKDFDNAMYKSEMVSYNAKRYNWMILKSLQATPELEWETVKYEDPNTWSLWEKELLESGISTVEVQRIMKGVFDANCLNEEKVEEARKRFLAGTVVDQQAESSCLQHEQSSTQSGDAAKVGD